MNGEQMTAVRTVGFRALVALLAGLSMVLVGLPTVDANAAGSLTQQRIATAQSVQAPAVTAAAGDREASAQQAGDPETCYSDPAGDVRRLDTDAPATGDRADRADIRQHCATYGSQLELNVRVATPTDPLTDENWRAGSFIGWFVDTTGDTEAEYFVEYSLDSDGALQARVSNIEEETPVVTCSAAALYEGERHIVRGIDSTCVGNARQVRLAPGFFYDAGGETGNGPVFYDVAPNTGGFEAALRRGRLACGGDPEPSDFADRDEVSPTHLPNVDCLRQLEIALGRMRNGRRLYFPHENVNRGQFAGFLFRTLQELNYNFPDPQRPRFSDVPANHTFDNEIHRLAAAGVITGFANNRYRPGATIRRDQTASLLVQAFEAVEGRNLRPENPGEHFSDTEGNVHSNNIDAAFEADMISGTKVPAGNERGLYTPRGLTNRERMASVLVRFLNATL